MDGKFKYSSIAAYYPDNALIGLKVYPAPVKNEMTVQHSIVSRNSKITIIAMDGKVMLTVLPKLNSQQTTIDVSGMMAGMYILKFENGKKVEAIKFAKQ